MNEHEPRFVSGSTAPGSKLGLQGGYALHGKAKEGLRKERAAARSLAREKVLQDCGSEAALELC